MKIAYKQLIVSIPIDMTAPKIVLYSNLSGLDIAGVNYTLNKSKLLRMFNILLINKNYASSFTNECQIPK